MNSFNNMINAFKGSGATRYFVVLVLVLYAGFVWATFNGVRFLGDDADSKEERGAFKGHNSGSRRHHFYHK